MGNLTTKEKKALTDFRKALVADFGALDVRLFGSRARGEGDEESDLDVFIVIPQIDWELEKKIYGLSFDISLEHGVLISPILYSQKDIENPVIMISPLYKTVQREGMKI
ncbi:MAG TPA: nucleotidyltransferase domain-containing protein [Nitrospirae bacterium]|nr:nucleotidyltransferase domain-containing protein [Nitrospirota bacterium]